MSEIVKAMEVLVSPCEKLMDMTRDAIGKAYEPRYQRRIADAEAYKKRLETDAEVYQIAEIGKALRESADIPITYNKDGLTISTADEEFVKRTQNRLAYQELTKQKNIESVIDHAYEQLKDEADVPNNPVDPDWINRFFNSVAEVSSEDMQRIWGKILAGEVKQPGSFSLRTLQVIKNINKEEAKLFEKIAPFIMSCHADKDKTFFDSFLFAGKIMHKYGIYFPDIMRLNDAGLLYENAFITVGFELMPNETDCFLGCGKKIEVTNIDEMKSNVICSAYVLTEAGKELLPIVLEKCASPAKEYFSDCSNEIQKAISRELHRAKIEIVDYEADQ